ncbi:MAG: hypothetical protein HRT87_03455 [Legionellales bacterium]|nr:hypothetical protein [Legionellales bacterium]
MDIPPEMYIACTEYTEEDISRIRAGLTKKENETLDQVLEITGHHKSDYDTEMGFHSNYNNDDYDS